MAACEILPIGILSVFTPTFLHHYDIFPYSLIFVIFSKGLFFIAAYLLIFFFKKETYHPQKIGIAYCSYLLGCNNIYLSYLN